MTHAEIRRKILAHLAKGSATTGELTRAIGVSSVELCNALKTLERQKRISGELLGRRPGDRGGGFRRWSLVAAAAGAPEARLHLVVNGHTLGGERRDYQWSFTCKSFPEIAAKYNGDTTSENAVGEFMARVLTGGVRFRFEFAQGV